LSPSAQYTPATQLRYGGFTASWTFQRHGLSDGRGARRQLARLLVINKTWATPPA
jgi:hypothetical protein